MERSDQERGRAGKTDEGRGRDGEDEEEDHEDGWRSVKPNRREDGRRRQGGQWREGDGMPEGRGGREHGERRDTAEGGMRERREHGGTTQGEGA